MDGSRVMPGWLAVVACLAGVAPARAEAPAVRLRTRAGSTRPTPAAVVALDLVPEEYRERVRLVLERPAMQACGPVETFHCQPQVYHWLLDHPDAAVRMWHKLGAKCA